MTIEISELAMWHDVVEKCMQEKAKPAEFCRQHNLDPQKYQYYKARLFHKRFSNPNFYQELVPICREYLESGATASMIAVKYGVSRSDVLACSNSLKYLDSIAEYKSQNRLNFIKVPQSSSPVHVIEESEVLTPKNSVELMISKGIKVIVAPEVGSDKLIRIIELLKDL